MHKSERHVFFFDIALHSWHRKYKGLKPLPHHTLVKALRSMHSSDAAEYSNGRGDIYIEDIIVGANRCEILVGYSNKEAADPTLNNRPKKKRRIIEKDSGEGVETSAHILWRYKDADDAKDSSFFLEAAAGLSSTVVVRFINRLLRLYGQSKRLFTVDDPEGKKKVDGTFDQIEVRPYIELRGHPSNELIKDLQRGELTELELYTNARQSQAWDTNAYTVFDHESVVLKPNPKKLVGKAKALVDLAIGTPNNFDKARIKFKTDAGVDRSVRVFSDSLKLVNDNGYVRKELIDEIGDNLPNAFSKIYQPLMNKMKLLR